MDTTQRGIITLIKSAVTEQPQSLPEGFDLEAAYPILKRHHMSTLVYDGAVRCGIPRTEPMMQKLFGEYCKVLLLSERQLTEVSRVFAAFEEAGIDYMPLKGSVMKHRYPKQELRIMGDADILIRMEQYDRILPIMESLGYRAKSGTDREMVWISDHLYLELHSSLYSTNSKRYYSYFGSGWSAARQSGGTRYRMTPETELIYMVTHIANHIQNGGIGCRHVTDLWVMSRAYPNMDMDYVKAELDKLDLGCFYENMRAMLSVWFEDAPETEVTEVLTEYFMKIGSWGDVTTKALAIVARYTDSGTSRGENRIVYALRTLFPNAAALRGKYTILQKAPWLLPLVWVYRPFYKLIFERISMLRHKKGIRALSKENVDRQRDFLRYIGLLEQK